MTYIDRPIVFVLHILCRFLISFVDLGNVGELPDVSMQTETSHHNMLFPTLDSSGAQTISFVVAGCVMGILFLVLIATVLIQRHGCSNKLCLVFRSSANGTSASGALHEQSTCHDQDRAALIAFTDGVQVWNYKFFLCTMK